MHKISFCECMHDDAGLASKNRQVKTKVSTNQSKKNSGKNEDRSKVGDKTQKDKRKGKNEDDDVIFVGVSVEHNKGDGKTNKNVETKEADNQNNKSKDHDGKHTKGKERRIDDHKNVKGKHDDKKSKSRGDDKSTKGIDGDKQGKVNDYDKKRKGRDDDKKGKYNDDDKKRKGREDDKKGKGKDDDDKKRKGRDDDKKGKGKNDDKKRKGRDNDKKGTGKDDDKKRKGRDDDKKSTSREYAKKSEGKNVKEYEKSDAEKSKRIEVPVENDDTFEIHTRTRKSDEFLEVPLTELDKHLHNIRTILLHSTATPIQNHTETGFLCGFCVAQFLTAAELKTHSLQKHGEEYIKRFMGGHNLYSYVVKLDITSLRCTLCARKIYTLELLIDHLQTKHDLTIHRDIPNHILPFKFQSDTFSCVICDRKFDRFKQMQGHMSTHYRNYECNDCTAAFINKATLRTHCMRHKTGIFNCHFCSKCFDTSEKLSNHEKFVHVANHKRNKCGECGEFFTKYTKKMQHMVDVHGHKTRVVKCMACDKTFSTKEKLTKHNKRDHLLERNYKCDVCGSGFFDNYDLRRHLRTHGDSKPFTCEVCNKGFNRKDNMLEHARTHTGEHKRFSCDRCGLNFSHMARLKRHTAQRHKELLETL